MKNLISNAVRASKKASSPPRVQLSSYCSGKNVHIEVSDNGPGIPKEVQAYLFKEMIPKEELAADRHGVGCLLTHFIAQEYGGRAFFLPSDEGAKVILELPLTPTPLEARSQ
jgi:sensor histidine kinase regulating citrate/malate metabolism